ncbi:MAG: hypothetical protein DDT36_01699 [Firmicutes bacterium]|nr:hypothetical protein [Bacillota bacterium]
MNSNYAEQCEGKKRIEKYFPNSPLFLSRITEHGASNAASNAACNAACNDAFQHGLPLE